ncbi:hypothetical protein LTR10_020691 [Elasticomyces elasticus]|uniref:Xylanolytic transcriptional activator regulatory domain-containing protein n=1 Tax=Exophiala sideris TaxID=1016849 RepID=A0ABR0JHC2_9EURO|nr:hypothetical protein LTR10_020691 [Elasticomyces elasticus]KAK5033562.1 hypothetical protein LTS07_003867 [Exophiala sideris]KAK5041943.1 hypothetical protein LTR13_001748 [Exophiala sideris]KAK5064106.1 hypothetical protein LTR69_003875 [Exophiala sideris]KAK5185211.1 hypothetical protein LTR44_002199 [Eurotiomycetes sp. CCFEE 6388]
MLEDVKLSHLDVINLIDHYYATFHPQFPILPDAATFISRYDANKLLLWSILSISAGGIRETASLYNSLVNPVRRLAGDIYSHQSRGLGAVQGLLLLCAWPFPYQHTVNDPSPMYAALAINLAQQLGLHRPPSFRSDFSYNPTRHEERFDEGERELAWYGCFVMDYTIAVRLGIPPSITSCQSIISEVAKGQSSSLPDTLLHLLHIAYLGQKTATLLGDDGSALSGLTSDPLQYIQLLGHDFQCTYASLKDKLSQQCKIFYLSTRLTLYSYAFNTGNDYDQTGLSDFKETEVSGKALSAVTELLQLACENFNATSCWPAFMKNCVIYATVMGSSIVARTIPSAIAVGSWLETCQAGNSLVRLWSLFPKDNYSRISAHISRFIDFINSKASTGAVNGHVHQIWQNELGGRGPVKSRMSANVLFNVIWPAKRAGNTTHLAPSSNRHRGDTATQRELQDGTSNQTFIDMTDPAYDDFDPMDNFQGLDIFDDIFADWSDLQGTAP